jgi:hypothetical protein
MFNIETIETWGLETAVRALRLPHKNTHLSDSRHEFVYDIFEIGEKDKRLVQSLILKGDDHAKAMRGVGVSCIINAPRYWWQEMATYRIGCECLSSESTMHCEAANLTGEELQRVKSEIKEGLEQKRVYTFTYQTLRRIYFQRRNHRLPEWAKFCKWIETLPYNELITIER